MTRNNNREGKPGIKVHELHYVLKYYQACATVRKLTKNALEGNQGRGSGPHYGMVDQRVEIWLRNRCRSDATAFSCQGLPQT